VGAWAKSYYFAVRAAMDSVLRPYDLGSTQWHVLCQLANDGPAMQRDLGRMLQIERATLSGIVATLVRKGLIDQMPGSQDQRQRVLRLTDAGLKLWGELPDPLALIRAIAFDGSDAAELATALRVLRAATQRLNDHMSEAANRDDLDHGRTGGVLRERRVGSARTRRGMTGVSTETPGAIAQNVSADAATRARPIRRSGRPP
jgi:DNA-binding MarR family transcriptional regulator